ncbi:ATP-binding protein [Metabacillus bambusae]|uniref:ATP-binding protein n=1 Tax=Metabacillus bambusae TaxID=2795218 RepID=A0ABS3N0T7_9BACI|nr:ATP-binding protein [Metabacillus bambusae]
MELKETIPPIRPYHSQSGYPNLELIYIKNLQDIIDILARRPPLQFIQTNTIFEENKVVEKDFNQIIGHEFAKRALEIAAASEHYVMMDGPPGCGKSLLVESFPTILPPCYKKHNSRK